MKNQYKIIEAKGQDARGFWRVEVWQDGIVLRRGSFITKKVMNEWIRKEQEREE